MVSTQIQPRIQSDPQLKCFTGHVDEACSPLFQASGWAIKREDGEPEVDLYINGNFKESFFADVERQDLIKAGIPNANGFSFSLKPFLDPGLNEIEIRSHGTANTFKNGRKMVAHIEHARFPFNHYASRFNEAGTIARHARNDLTPDPDYFQNYLGVKIAPKYFPDRLADAAGLVEGMPIPGNHNAGMAEWAACLRAVELSRDRFTVIELGCAFGIWLINTGVLAKRLGRQVKVVGVEGDQGLFELAKEATAANGFSPEEVALFHGIVASDPGTALFPIKKDTGFYWGLEPTFESSEEKIKQAVDSGNYQALPMIPLIDLVEPYSQVDLLHVDIQGSEADLLETNLSLIEDRVAYIVIGTHARQIEGRLFDLFLNQGWVLEMEQPATLDIQSDRPNVVGDGLQAWRNPRLAVVS